MLLMMMIMIVIMQVYLWLYALLFNPVTGQSSDEVLLMYHEK